MNILFIGPYKTASGWGVAAREYIKSLHDTGHNITIRPIFMDPSREDSLDLLLYKLENKTYDHYDVCIQNVLPQYLEYDKRYGKNIALVHIESGNLTNVWPRKLSMMDEIWVPSDYSKRCLVSSGVDPKKIQAIPIPTDIEKYKKEYPRIPLDKIKDNFVFYFISEYIQRKNLGLLIRAFHTEFHSSEKVELLIKTNRSGLSGEQLVNHLYGEFTKIKNKLKIYPKEDDYKGEIIITDRISEEEIYGLHQSCDCFVLPSSGESWSLPSVDAYGFGNQVILTDVGSAPAIGAYTIKGYLDNIYSDDHPLDDLYTSKEKWIIPLVNSLQDLMRTAFENGRDKDEWSKKDVSRFSYNSISIRMKELLCQQ